MDRDTKFSKQLIMFVAKHVAYHKYAKAQNRLKRKTYPVNTHNTDMKYLLGREGNFMYA